MPKRWKAIAGALVVLIGAFAAALFVYAFPWATRVEITGVVIDPQTQQPVPDARVIVSPQRKGLVYDFSVAWFGVLTDENGRFAVSQEAPRRFNDVLVEAAIRPDRYGYQFVGSTAKDVRIETPPLPAAIAGYWWMQYDRFRGHWLRPDDVVFLNGSWPMDEP